MGQVYFNYDVTTFDDGSAEVRCQTNDNGDTGYPGEYAEWSDTWKDAKKAIAHCGVSRIGCMGSKVTVTVDGVEQVELPPDDLANKLLDRMARAEGSEPDQDEDEDGRWHRAARLNEGEGA